MKFLRGILPHLSISLHISVLILLYLDSRNPMMGFLSGAPFVVLMSLTAACAIANAVMLYGDWRKRSSSGETKEENNTKISE